MCGRYTQYHRAEELAERFAVRIAATLAPRYNIAPTQLVPAIVQHDRRELIELKWGLVPYWAQDATGGHKLINARAETLAEKPSFKQAFAKRRCLIPADGFYEWRKAGKGPKQPIYVRRRDGGLFAFAGLWEEWRTPTGEWLRTCTIITVEPNALIAAFHHRMAAILRHEDEAAWLAPDNRALDLTPLLRPYDAAELAAFPVSAAVNSPAFDDPSCLASIAAGSGQSDGGKDDGGRLDGSGDHR